MLSSVYCFVSGGSIHCVPVNTVNEYSQTIINEKKPYIHITPPQDQPTKSDDLYIKLKSKNLLYNLNNPSLSDIESDSNDTSEDSEYMQKVIDDYLAHSLYFPDYSIDLPDNLNDNYSQIKQFLGKVFLKTWSDKLDIFVKRLTGGITNMLLQCTYKPKNDSVLMRVYGPGTNLIIDRHREFILHLVLNSIHLAPPVHARFKNGLIYGFLNGRSLENFELKHDNLYPLIAQQLGNWHKLVDINAINQGVNKLRDYTRASKRKSIDQPREKLKKDKKPKKRSISNIWELIEDWIHIVPVIPQLVQSFQENMKDEVNDANVKQKVLEEFMWLRDTLSKTNSPIVSCHCDLLSGNIIIPNEDYLKTPIERLPPIESNPIKFIDYEYMLPAPRAFDIANHLAEWQGFDCDRSAIPEPSLENETLKRWVKSYINDFNASEAEVKQLIDEIYSFYGVPGFYWGIWAAIQSEISNIDFSYANYSKSRLQEYWDWKESFI